MSEGRGDSGSELDEDEPFRAENGPRTSLLDAAPAAPSVPRPAVPPLRGETRAVPRPEPRILARAASTSALSPRLTAVFGGLFGLATIASVFALLIQVFPVKDQRAAIANAAASAGSNPEPPVRETPKKHAEPTPKRVRQELPQPWRVEDLKATHQLVKGEMMRRSLSGALDEEHVPKDQVYRVLKAMDGVFKFDHPRRKDRFIVALERGTKTLVGFEYIVSPIEIYQAKANEHGFLEAKRLDMQVKEEEFSASFYIGKNFATSYEAVGLEPGFTKAVNEAFSGQTSTEAFEEGGVLKAILVERTALGHFVDYERVKAVEYRPADPAKPPLRAYWFEGETVKSYVDDKGRHSSNAGWRSPVPGAPITSNFNPRRLHPVLHTVMPHNGTDFGAPTGTPVYASFRGKIVLIGPQGPSGNLVLIEHPNGVQTGYAHLSRFAAGIKVGDPIGTHQLVGYVGSTGRSTGPHLHFSAKRDGKFFDSVELKVESLQLLPTGERGPFANQKAAYDKALETIQLPDPPEREVVPSEAPVAPENAEGEALRGDANGSSSAAKGEASSPEPSPSAPRSEPAKTPVEAGGPKVLGEDLSGEIE